MRFSSPKMHQIEYFLGLRPEPARDGGGHSALLDFLAGGEGSRCPITKNLSAALGLSGLERRALGIPTFD